MFEQDTIVALATPPGQGGIGIVRISGANTTIIGRAILGRLPSPRKANYLSFLQADGSIIDNGLAIYFPSPHSFTGEDVLELQGHGGPVIMDLLVKRVLELGARLARPGEFSQRAFLNNKLDLVQAEAIADLIAAGSEQAARAAQQSLQGVFSNQINTLLERLTYLRMYVEAAIDFPEEEVDFLVEDNVTDKLHTLDEMFKEILDKAKQGRLLHEGIRVVLAGQPNVGKSSLLNALAGQDAAIVTDVPGTTRDALREEINLDGMPLHVIDTAGLHESSHVVEKEGMRRTWDEIDRGDRMLLVVEDSAGLREEDQAILMQLDEKIPVSVVRNKIDLSHKEASLSQGEYGMEILLSARTGEGIDLLRDHLKTSMGFTNIETEGCFIARRRHIDALQRAQDHVQQGIEQIQLARAGELLAEELRLAQQDLSEITGKFTADDLLGEIFSSFCIGK